MEQWRDQGIVLSARAHGESGAVLWLLTESHGRHGGYVRGGQSSKLRPSLQPGNLVSAAWGSRVDDGLGYYTVEPEQAIAALLMDDPLKLAALQSACALCDAALPEREQHPGLFHGLLALGDIMQQDSSKAFPHSGGRLDGGGSPQQPNSEVANQSSHPPIQPSPRSGGKAFDWAAIYVLWELAFLRELGYGIELNKCAQGGDPATLEWVSPKSGCAVSAAAGEPYKDRLLPLPAFLKPEKGGADDTEVLKGLRLTRHFLEHRIFAQLHGGMPEERLRFEEWFAKNSSNTNVILSPAQPGEGSP